MFYYFQNNGIQFPHGGCKTRDLDSLNNDIYFWLRFGLANVINDLKG